MQAVGILFLTMGIWYVYAGIKGFRPMALLLAIVQKPDQANQLIADAETFASTHKADFDNGGETDGSTYSGGGSFDDPDSSKSGNDPKSYATSRLAAFGWGKDQFAPLDSLWTKESGWNPKAKNPSSGAYGIPQALPGIKMAAAGADWQTNYKTQIDWGLGYIRSRYGSPAKAWEHSQATNWY